MLAMSLPGQRFRAIALLASASFALHQLRYSLAYGRDAQEQLGVQGHDYFGLVLPIVVTFGLVALLAFAVRIAAASGTGNGERPLLCTRALWARASAVLLGVYGVQEGLEGAIEPAHDAGIAAVFGHGGWLAVPLALVLGALLAFLLKGAALAIEVVAKRSPVYRRTLPALQTLRERPAQRPALDEIALFLAGRGPPPTSH
jgi:hypothetical protein